MIKGFLLDIDGTLVKSNNAHTEAWVEAFKHFGYDVSYEIIRPLIGMGSDQLLPVVLQITNERDEDKGKRVIEYRKKIFLEKYAPSLKPTNGARKLVAALQKKGIKLVVATSASKEEIDMLLQAADVKDLLTTFVSATDVQNSKPAPDIITAALKKIGLPEKEVMLLGDTPYDIAAGKKCGVKVIALRSGGFSVEQLKDAYGIFADPEDVYKHLDEIFNVTLHEHKQYGPWTILNSKTLYKNPWIKVVEDNVIQPDGKKGTYTTVYMLPGVSILPVDDEGNVYLTEEFRYAYKQTCTETISGGVEEGETHLETAKRELEEESGLKAKEFIYVGELNPFTSIIHSRHYLYIAKDLSNGEKHLEGTEVVQIKKVPLQTALKWVKTGKITHAATIVLLYTYEHMLSTSNSLIKENITNLPQEHR